MIRKILSGVLAVALLAATTLPTTGCSASQVTNEINVVLTQATNILVVADPTATWVPQLQAAVTALKTAESSWSSGGSVQIVIDALNTVEAITAVVPLTAAYSPLIDIMVAGIEAAITALEPSVPANSVAAAHRIQATQNPHIGRVSIAHHAFHSRSTEFKDAWNASAKVHNLVGAEIK